MFKLTRHIPLAIEMSRTSAVKTTKEWATTRKPGKVSSRISVFSPKLPVQIGLKNKSKRVPNRQVSKFAQNDAQKRVKSQEEEKLQLAPASCNCTQHCLCVFFFWFLHSFLENKTPTNYQKLTNCGNGYNRMSFDLNLSPIQ